MAGKVLNLKNVLVPDRLGCAISTQYITNETLRREWKDLQSETRKYVYQTDTSQTTNSTLPWHNKTCVPKICQIRDNLIANYVAALFPKRRWLNWLAGSAATNNPQQRKMIIDYISHCVNQTQFKTEMFKLVQDFVDYGNCIGTPTWVDERSSVPVPGSSLYPSPVKTGFAGPSIRRISPMDINFNPTAPTFRNTPKIERTITSLGEVKKIIDSQASEENREAYEALWNYIKDIRLTTRSTAATDKDLDDWYRMDGFTSFRSYLESDYIEILTFYGDIYDWDSDTFLENHVVMVVDRHKVISKKQNPSFFGYAPLYHAGWRTRQDSLMAMGPLHNLIGMQHRIDHLENAKADVLDLIVYPVLKVKGYVQDFNWGPMERIVTDGEGDVEMLAPDYQVLQMNIEIQNYMDWMELFAGAPKEAMGFRTPGEKTAYEVTQLQNAAARIFQNKIMLFEEQIVEPLLNGMLELARRNLSDATEISIFDDEFNYQGFVSLTVEDITGSGTVKAVGARHFAEQAELVQNLTQFASSAIGADPAIQNHFSSFGMAKLIEDALNLQDYGIVSQNIRITEAADAMRLQQSAEEQVMMESQTPAGIQPDDHDPEVDGVPEAPPIPVEQ